MENVHKTASACAEKPFSGKFFIINWSVSNLSSRYVFLFNHPPNGLVSIPVVSRNILSAPLLGEYNPNIIGIPLPLGLQFFQEFGMFICKIVRLSRIFLYVIKMPFPGTIRD